MTRHNIDIQGLPYFPGIAVAPLQKGIEGDIAQRIVLISHDDISDFALLPMAFIVIESVPFSHKMLHLLGLGVPTVLISAQQALTLEQNMPLVVNGCTGLISNNLDVVLPAEDLTRTFEPGNPVLMVDGSQVNLCASVSHALAAGKASSFGATGIGLVRSEFVLPENNLVPDKAFYLDAFGEICEAASPLRLTFRLLDLAADKTPLWLKRLDAREVTKGMQGVRLYSDDSVRAVIDAQLSALAALSNQFSIKVLLPFLVRLEEYEHWQTIIRQHLPESIQIGAMVETPAMLLDIAPLLEHADFIAIGCNDLMQQLYAADRDQSELHHYLDPYAPLLYRLFRQVAKQSGERVKEVQLCGLLSQIPGVLPVLLGLGYRTFSVEAAFIPHLANTISKMTITECEAVAKQVCAAKTTQQVLEILQQPTDRHPPFCL